MGTRSVRLPTLRRGDDAEVNAGARPGPQPHRMQPRLAARLGSGGPRVRRTVQTQWLAFGAALVVLAGVVVAWAVGSAGRRVMVVQVARPVSAGHVFVADDLMLTGVAFDPTVDALVPAASLDALVGRVAAIDLRSGVLLQHGMWRETPALLLGERAVGAVLEAGRFPLGIAVGDVVVGDALSGVLLPVEVDPAASQVGGGVDDPVLSTLPTTMRVIEAVELDDGRMSLTFAVPMDSAVAVARLAGTNELVVVGTRPGDASVQAATPPDTAP